jgi:hypothetical protein
MSFRSVRIGILGALEQAADRGSGLNQRQDYSVLGKVSMESWSYPDAREIDCRRG